MSDHEAELTTKEYDACWFGDEDEAVLVDPSAGRIVGHYAHDGYGKWEISVCLPYWRAWRVLREEPAGFLSFAGFPRCWLWLFRMKSHESAVAVIEEFARPAVTECQTVLD